MASLAVAQLRDGPTSSGTTASTTVASTAVPTTAPATTEPATTAAPTSAEAPTSSTPLVDAATVSLAAESLIAPYIESQYSLAVTDVACSTPATGDEGEQFVCYALRPEDFVIALRATIGGDQVVALSLITDLAPPATDEVPATSAP